MEGKKKYTVIEGAIIGLFIIALLIPGLVSYQHEAGGQEYQFKSFETFERCRALIQENRNCYVLYGSSELDSKYVAYVRDVTCDFDERMEFVSKQDLDRFVKEETIPALENIPVLAGSVQFFEHNDGKQWVVTYEQIYTNSDIWKSYFNKLPQYMCVWMIMSISVLYICAKKK